MKKALKPYSFLFYFLVIVVFFILGGLLSNYLGVARNQGLAGGAIVLGYALMTALGALLVAIILAGRAKARIIVRVNIILFSLLAVLMLLGYLRFLEKQKDNTPPRQRESIPKPTVPAQSINHLVFKNEMGQGFFKPDYFENEKYFFYSPYEKNAWNGGAEPIDSLVIGKNQNGQFTIRYAPSYFFPAIVKLDYDLLMIKVLTSGKFMVEVEINQETGQTVLLDKFSGDLIYWPEFIITINSVEILEKHPQNIRVKPMENASVNPTVYEFLQPIAVRGDWLKVNLTDSNYSILDQGWIKWKSDKQLLIRYNLFS
jgi:hypothetical protein